MSGYEVSVDECMRVLHVSREVFLRGVRVCKGECV